MKATKAKTWRYVLFTAGIVLLIVEFSNFVFFEYLLPPRLEKFLRVDLDALENNATEDTFAQVDRMYDAELGWNIAPNQTGGSEVTGCLGADWSYTVDDKGSRDIPVTYDNRMISLYGDSYTFGAEVNNDKTWQYFLSNMTKTYVENYAVWGYGPDQALLKLKRNLHAGLGTPVVILGVYSENVRRIVGSYRSFLTGSFSPIEFKPLLVPEGDGYRWDTTQLMDSFDRESFIRAFEAAKQNDYWYALNTRKPDKAFPYTWSLVKLAKFAIFDYLLSSRNMWNNQRAQGPFREILRQFLQLSEQYAFLPILVFMPEAGELDGYTQGKPSYYAEFLEQLKSDGTLKGLTVVDVYKERFDPRRFTYWDETEICHPSEFGHRIIAEAIMNHAGEEIEAIAKKSANEPIMYEAAR